MFDLCSDRLLESEERFSERNGHHFIEMWDCGVSWLHNLPTVLMPMLKMCRLIISQCIDTVS
jgi:hypothetical protein